MREKRPFDSGRLLERVWVVWVVLARSRKFVHVIQLTESLRVRHLCSVKLSSQNHSIIFLLKQIFYWRLIMALIRKTTKVIEKWVKVTTFSSAKETYLRETWWFLFIPVFSQEKLIHRS